MSGTCINDWCERPRKYADGRCVACRRREVWGPLHAESEREKARQRAAARRQAARERRIASPVFFEPPS